MCAVLKPRVILPVHDATVALAAADRSALEAMTHVALPKPATLAVLIDKTKTLELAERLKIPVPLGVPIDDPTDAGKVAREVGLPAVVKPVESWVTAEDGTSRRVISRGVTSVGELEMAAEALRTAGARVLVQEWLPGAREAISLVAVDGHAQAHFAQVAHRTSPPLGGASVLRESIPIPADSAASANRLVAAVGLDGYAEVEFRRDRRGRAALMEVNPRLSASVEIAVRSGIDFPHLLFRHALGDSLPATTTYRKHVRMRWLGGDLLWLRAALADPGGIDVPHRVAAIRQFAGEFLRVPHYDYVAADDWRPLVVAARAMLGGSTVRRRRRRQ
jgi:predicted ATP-grasp superfamily ATP-dependent carboligase